MGKRGHNRRSRLSQRVDQHVGGDGPGSAKRGLLRTVGGRDHVDSAGHEAHNGPILDNDNGLAIREGDVRGVELGIRVPRGQASPIRRAFDAADINPILNDPDVLPSITGPGIESVDVSEILANPQNVCLVADGGALMFIFHEPGIYEVHNNWLKAYRGKAAIDGTRAALRWMFTRTDCMTILTKIPAFNRAAARLCALVGGKKRFDRKAVWPTKDGMVDMSFWSLSYDDWVCENRDLMASGHAFHVKLDEEFARHEKIAPRHEDEDCHDLHVGACVEMIYGSQPEKGFILYNRWAAFAGYKPVALLSRNPLVVDIGDAVLQIVGDNSFKAVLCR